MFGWNYLELVGYSIYIYINCISYVKFGKYPHLQDVCMVYCVIVKDFQGHPQNPVAATSEVPASASGRCCRLPCFGRVMITIIRYHY